MEREMGEKEMKIGGERHTRSLMKFGFFESYVRK